MHMYVCIHTYITIGQFNLSNLKIHCLLHIFLCYFIQANLKFTEPQ